MTVSGQPWQTRRRRGYETILGDVGEFFGVERDRDGGYCHPLCSGASVMLDASATSPIDAQITHLQPGPSSSRAGRERP